MLRVQTNAKCSRWIGPITAKFFFPLVLLKLLTISLVNSVNLNPCDNLMFEQDIVVDFVFRVICDV